MRRPVLLSPERHDDLNLAPSPFLSCPVLPPRALGKEERAGEQRPSLPPSKGQRFLSPWRMEGRNRGGRRRMMEECGMPPPPLLINGAESGLGRPTQPIQQSGAQGIGTDPLPQSTPARFPASATCHLHGGHVAREQDRGDG